MPQTFQVLRCFKCFVFQVHQTKKINKWDCKLCGERQSIKRHYGLGTGKECRLQVQKLNSIRGEVEDKIKQSESSDEEITNDAIDLNQIQSNVPSKWSEFIDETENKQVTEEKFVEDTEVFLEIPKKRRKFHKPKANNNPATKLKSTFSENETSDKVCFQSKMSDVHESLVLSNIATNKDELSCLSLRKKDDSSAHKTEIKSFVPKIAKSSKWAQFTADEENDDYEDSHINEDNNENMLINNLTKVLTSSEGNPSISESKSDSTSKNLKSNIFSQCDENDIDNKLDL